MVTQGMVDEFRVIFDIIDNTGSGELDLLGVKRACGLLGQKRPSAGVAFLKKRSKGKAMDFLSNSHPNCL